MLVQNKKNAWKVTDLSKAVPVEPLKQNLVESLGVFAEDLRQTRTVTIERDVIKGVVVPKINYDGRRVNITPDATIQTTVSIPRVGIEDSVKVSDLQDYITYGGDVNQAVLDALATQVAKKTIKLDTTLRDTLEVDRISTLMTGSPFDPTGVLRRSYGTFNIYSELGITRGSVEVDFTGNPTETVNNLYTTIRDKVHNYAGVGRIVVLCGKKMFAAIQGNEYVLDIKTRLGDGFTMSQLLGRPATDGLDYRFRSTAFGDVLWIDASAALKLDENGALVPVVADDQGVAFPMGDGLYTTYFAPEQRFDTVNRPAVPRMLRERMNDDQDLYNMIAESNFFNMLEVPEAVVTVTGKYTP